MRSTGFAKLLTLAGLFTLLSPIHVLAEACWGTARIVGLEVTTRYPSPSPESFSPLIPLEVGQKTSPGEVQAVERMLEDSKLFRSVSVRVYQSAGGVSIMFHLWQKERVRAIKIHGNWIVLDSAIRRILGMQEGEPFDEKSLPGECARIEALYEKRGWYGTRVHAQYDRDPHDGSVRIEYRIHRGRRVRIDRIVLDGVGAGDPDRIRKILRIPWPLVSARRIDNRVEKVRAYYQSIGYPKARVSIEGFEPDLRTGKALLRVRVEEGKRLVLNVEGSRRVSSKKILRVTTFSRNRGYGFFDAEDSAEAIRRLYEKRGFPEARVTFEREENPREVRILFHVEEGDRVFVRRVRLEGNQSLSDRELARHLLTRPRSLLLFRRGTFETRRWNKDLDGLVGRYMTEGFLDVKVKHSLERVADRKGRADVVVRIEEGPRYTIGELRFEGVGPGVEAELKRQLRFRPGEPFFEGRLAREARRICRYYAKRGHLLVRVDPDYTIRPDRTVAVEFRVHPGPLFRHSGLVVSGNRRTRLQTIRSAFRLGQGQPIDDEKLASARKRLYRLGIFERLSIRVPGLARPGECREDREPEEIRRPVLVEVKEGKPLGMELGVRFDSDLGLEGLASLRHDNLFGRAKRIKLDVLGGKERSEARARYTDPTLMAYRAAATGQAEYRREVRDAYTKERGSLEAGLYRALPNRLTPGLFLLLEHAVVFDVASRAADAPEPGSTTNLFVRPQLVWDRRDSKLYPQKGTYGQLRVAVSSASWGSNDELVMNNLRIQAYRRVAGNLTLACRLSWDHVEPFGKTDTVPATYLLFAGGNNSVRGFPRDGLGPRDEAGRPKGGTTRVIANLEGRFPIYRALNGVVFVDTGSLTEGVEAIGLSTFRWAAGAGLRLHTPVGPVRLECGYQLQPNPPLDRYEVHFSLGFPF